MSKICSCGENGFRGTIERLSTRLEELTEENAELREEINSLEYAMEDEARIFKDRITELEQQLIRTQQYILHMIFH